MATTSAAVLLLLLLLSTVTVCYGSGYSGYSSGEKYGSGDKDVFEFDLSGRYGGGGYGAGYGYGRGEQSGSGYKGGNGNRNEGHDNYDRGYSNKDGRSTYSCKGSEQHNSQRSEEEEGHATYGEKRRSHDEYNSNGHGESCGEKRGDNNNNNNNTNNNNNNNGYRNNNGYAKSGDQGKYSDDGYGYGNGNGNGGGQRRDGYGKGY